MNLKEDKKNIGFAFDSLKAVRKKLLDLSHRNKLLNYKHPKISCIRLIDKLPDQIFDVLTLGKVFTFIPIPEPSERELIDAGYIEIDPLSKQKTKLKYPTAEQWAKHIGFDTRYELPEPKGSGSRLDKLHDTNLQTLLYSAELESRLRSIRSQSETAIEDSGSNILYLSIGFLEWFENSNSDVKRMAPLFTLPVQLEKSRLDKSLGVYRYTLTIKDDGLLTNITFLEKLAHDFDFILPMIHDDSSPEEYFKNIRSTILKQQPKWKLHRQASLVLLNFSKQAMYQDLNPDNWPSDSRIENHEVIKMFFEGRSEPEQNSGDDLFYEDEHKIDDIQDVHESFPLIYDADSSQHSSLIDAIKGNNLVIEGPPGSGKSQTITNLIAASIANGKTVLFVAEKMAALNVVQKRLEQAGLSDFCMELHSHKTKKINIIQNLTKRLNKQSEYRSPASIDSYIERYESSKSKLSKYAHEVNKKWGNTGLTIHQILNKATRYREKCDISLKLLEFLEIEGINGKNLTQIKLDELSDEADELECIFDQISEQAEDSVIKNHYWYGIYNTNLMAYQVRELNSYLSSWSKNLKIIHKYWSDIISKYQLNTDENTTFIEIQGFIASLGQLPKLNGNEALSEIGYINTNHDQFNHMVYEYKRLHEVIDSLTSIITPRSINNVESTDTLTTCLNVFQKLGVEPDITLDEISVDSDNLGRLNELIRTIKKKFDQVGESAPEELRPCFEVTPNGFKEFSTLVNFINNLPSELWQHRDELFDNPDFDETLTQIATRLADLKPMGQELFDKFSLHRLPSSDELIKYKDTLDSAGLFRIFSSEWRNTKKSLLKLSAKPKADKQELLNYLPDLIAYVKRVEEVDKLNNQDPVLDKLYSGTDTPIDRIIALREWYKSVRNEYGISFGSRVPIANLLLNIDRNLAISIVDVANHGLLGEVTSSLLILQGITDKYTEYRCKDQTQLYGENNPVEELRLDLASNIEKVSHLIVVNNIAVHKIGSINDQLKTLNKDVRNWLKNEVTQYIVPSILPISVVPGEYSEKYFVSAVNTLNISKALMGNFILLNSIISKPNTERYNALCSCLPNLIKFESDIVKSRGLFKNLGEVNLSEWIDSSGDKINNIYIRNIEALNNPEWMNTWLGYVKLRKNLSSKGLINIIASLESEKIQAKELKDIIQLVIFYQLSNEILTKHSYFAQFSGMEQTSIRERFQACDRELMSLQCEKIAYKSSKTKPPIGNARGKVSTFTETSLIKHEAGKKTKHIAVRSLLKRAGKSIQVLKPCFMMSPMSVAQFLTPGELKFDLVVMDEASQIRPEDALGSIARGSSLVVVGDPKQLPPTSFFSKVLSNDDGDDVVALEESESILESVIPIFKIHRLRWHYRSRHESLIAFSNQNFYDSNLILFPSPFQESDEFGIRFKYISRGRFHIRRNVEEAREVVNAVSEQLKENPGESVGIVAMNSEQQAEIEMQLDQLAKDDSILSDARDKNRLSEDPLFIKNLENVQGDERDVIIISMTYGPEQVGSSAMHQRFGPINSNVGWRRLNVLFTRSKKRMHIFSTMSSGHIRANSKSSRGLQALKAFLEYCETGHLNQSVHTGKPAESDFEIAVMRELDKHGYECEPQLGVAGYYLDLAIRDPGQPGRFLMGVECDGATYHSAKSTRDRDRLRQDILENLGWRIRRIWSTDWFNNPQPQIQPIIQELDRLKTSDINIVLNKESPNIVLDGDRTGKLEGGNLKERLISLSENIIKKDLFSVDSDHRLLRPAMREAILNHLPCSKSEFLEQIPRYLRSNTDIQEAQEYLGIVLELVAGYGE